VKYPTAFLLIFTFLSVICSAEISHAQEKASKSQTESLKMALKSLNLENPEVDANQNLSNRDPRFICICGYACYTPGVEKDDLALTKKYGSRCLEGTSDVVEGDEHGKLIEAARNYAVKYNAVLLKKLKSKTE
jgi:hypothetical protein